MSRARSGLAPATGHAGTQAGVVGGGGIGGTRRVQMEETGVVTPDQIEWSLPHVFVLGIIIIKCGVKKWPYESRLINWGCVLVCCSLKIYSSTSTSITFVDFFKALFPPIPFLWVGHFYRLGVHTVQWASAPRLRFTRRAWVGRRVRSSPPRPRPPAEHHVRSFARVIIPLRRSAVTRPSSRRPARAARPRLSSAGRRSIAASQDGTANDESRR